MSTEAKDAQKGPQNHQVEITINKKKVQIEGPRVTGIQIKEAAIAQGVSIDIAFTLSEVMPSGEHKVIGDHDTIAVNNHSTFIATANDDNS